MEKAGYGACQVRTRKTSESEPFDDVSKTIRRRLNREGGLARDQPNGNLFTGWVASGMEAA
jgi:hypothetical protein